MAVTMPCVGTLLQVGQCERAPVAAPQAGGMGIGLGLGCAGLRHDR